MLTFLVRSKNSYTDAIDRSIQKQQGEMRKCGLKTLFLEIDHERDWGWPP